MRRDVTLRRLPRTVDVVKKFITAVSSKEGEFDTSTTTDAPSRTSASPSPVSVLTPELGEAATAFWPCSLSFFTSFDPMSPLSQQSQQAASPARVATPELGNAATDYDDS
jgi:hypothetical protein